MLMVSVFKGSTVSTQMTFESLLLKRLDLRGELHLPPLLPKVRRNHAHM